MDMGRGVYKEEGAITIRKTPRKKLGDFYCARQ